MIEYIFRLRALRRWPIFLILGILVVFFCFFLKSSSFNKDLFLWLNSTYHHPVIWQYITILGDTVVIVAVCLPLLMRDAKFRNIVFLSAIVCWVLVRSTKLFFAELRPLSIFSEFDFFVLGIKLYHHSFPSGHAATIATLIFSVIRYYRLNFVEMTTLICCLILIAFSRVMVGAHWPVDVIAGAFIAMLSVNLAFYFRDKQFLTSPVFSRITGAIFVGCAMYIPWHNTGYPITNWVVLVWTVLGLFVSALLFSSIRQDQRQNALTKTYFLWIFLISIIFLFEEIIGWKVIFQQWGKLSIVELFSLILLTMLSYWIRALRLQFHYLHLMKGQLTKAFWITSWHNFANNVLPFRVGEVAYPILLKRYFNINYTNSVATLVVFRGLDLYAIMLIGTILYSFNHLSLGYGVYLSILILLAPLLIWLLVSYFSNSKYISSFARNFDGGEFTLKVIAISAVLSLINWLSKLLAFTVLIVSFGDISWFSAFFGSLGGELSSIAPFHGLMGFGTYEAGVSLGLSFMGVGIEHALLSAVNLHLFVLLSSVMSVGLAWLMDRRLCL